MMKFIENFEAKKLLKKLKVIAYSILAIVVVGILLSGIYLSSYKSKSEKYYYDYRVDMELSYWVYKSAIVDEVELFMTNKVKRHNISALVLLNECDRYDIDIRLPLCQGLIESHYGTAGLASHTNSIFNMGAFDGNKLDQILGIYKYTHPNQSIGPYLRLLRNSYLGNSKTEKDLLKNFVNLSDKRYATYERYEEELNIVWEEINTTTKLDSLLTEYRYLKVELNK